MCGGHQRRREGLRNVRLDEVILKLYIIKYFLPIDFWTPRRRVKPVYDDTIGRHPICSSITMIPLSCIVIVCLDTRSIGRF